MADKIKIKLKQIVSNPITQPMNGQPVIMGYEFPRALEKLGRDPIPVREKYAIARTLIEVDAWVKKWQEFYSDTLAKHGIKLSEYLRGQIEKMESQVKSAETNGTANTGTGLQKKQIEMMQKQLDGLLKNPQQDTSLIENDNTEAMNKFNELVKAEGETDVEFEYLNHRVPLNLDESKLEASEIKILLDIIEPIIPSDPEKK